MSRYAVNLAPHHHSNHTNEASLAVFVHPPQCSILKYYIIYENWTTDGMGRESRTLPPVTKVSMAVHHSQSNGEP